MRNVTELDAYEKMHRSFFGYSPSAVQVSKRNFISLCESIGFDPVSVWIDKPSPAAIILGIPVYVTWDSL